MVADMPADYTYEMQMPSNAYQEYVQEADAGKLSFNNNEITIPEVGVIQINMEELHNANNKIMGAVQEQEKMSDEDFDRLADFMDIMNGYCHNTKEFRDYNSAVQKVAEDKITGNEAALKDDLQNYYQKKDAYLEVEQKAMKDFTKELDNYPLYDKDNVLSNFKKQILDIREKIVKGKISEKDLEKYKEKPEIVNNINTMYGSYLACNDDDNITLDDNGMPEITENNIKRLMGWCYDNELATINDGMGTPEDRAFIKENAKKLMDLKKDEHFLKIHDDYLINRAAYDILSNSASFNKYFNDEQKGFDTLRMLSSEVNLARDNYAEMFNRQMNTEATRADIENSVLDNSYTESNYKDFLRERTSVPVNNNEFIRVQQQPEMKEMVQGIIAVLSDNTLENDQNVHVVKADKISSYADVKKDKDGNIIDEKDMFIIYHNNDTKTAYICTHGASDGTYERQPDDDTSKLVEGIIEQYKAQSKGKSKLNDDNVDHVVLVSCFPGLHKDGYNKEFNADIKLISDVDVPLKGENLGKDGYFGWRAVNKTDAELYRNALTPKDSKMLETKENRKELYQKHAQYYHNVGNSR